MALVAGVGQANALDPREAGMQAINLALNELGSVSPSLGIVFCPYRYDAQMVMSGISSLVSNMPVLGMSTSAGISRVGQRSHLVTVALLGGEDIQTETHWFSSYSQGSGETATRLVQLIGYEQRHTESLLVFGDGLNGNAQEFCDTLPASFPIVGGLSSGDAQSNSTFQFASGQSSSGGMAAAFIRGKIKVGIGYGHGWMPVGNHFRVTRSRGFWLRTLDGRPASESYAHLFGQPAREWSFPPLNHMARIYPLGFEQNDRSELVVRAPLRIEADGSFRMNAPLRDGSDGYLMVGSPAACITAAQNAAQQAMAKLGDSKPVLALVFVDLAWQTLMQAATDAEIHAIQEVIGPNVPIAGGYTLGQFTPAEAGADHPSFLNQHIVVALFAEK